MEGEGITIHTGFPNPATDTSIVPLDLTKLLVKHPPSTFFMRIDSNEWSRYGVYKEDIAIVDKALSPKPLDLVIWWSGGDFAMSKFHKLPLDSVVWGVVTSIIHQYRS